MKRKVIVGSTERAIEFGDERWSELLERHHAAVRAELERFGGRELDTAGDGFLASFDAPGQAVRCAAAIVKAVRKIELSVRAAVHTGECERIGDKLGGVAVHIGALILILGQMNRSEGAARDRLRWLFLYVAGMILVCLSILQMEMVFRSSMCSTNCS